MSRSTNRVLKLVAVAAVCGFAAVGGAADWSAMNAARAAKALAEPASAEPVEYYYLKGIDRSGTSSLAANKGGVGWVTRTLPEATDAYPVAGHHYVIDGGCHARTPENWDELYFAGESLTFVNGSIGSKMKDGGLVCVSNMFVTGTGAFAISANKTTVRLDGRCQVSDGAVFTLNVDDTTRRGIRFIGTLVGAGTFTIGGGSKSGAGSGVSVETSLAGFAGKLVVLGYGATAPCSVLDLPANPAAFTADGLTLNDGANLTITSTTRSGANLGTTLLGSATINVPEDVVVRMDGAFTGSAGFAKTGAGELVLGVESAGLSGTVSVTAGTLSYVSLPNATVVTSGSGVAKVFSDGKQNILATVSGYEGFEDDDVHSPTVSFAEPADGAGCTCWWRLDEADEWSAAVPQISEAGNYTVYYKITADGYGDLMGSVMIKLTKHTITASTSNTTCIRDGAAHGIGVTVQEPSDGYRLEWSADGATYSDEELKFDDYGVHAVFCRVSKPHYASVVLQAKVTIQFAGIMHVSPTGASVLPYETPATAATDIASPLAIAASGSRIVVESGDYAQTAVLRVPSGVSLEGPADRSVRIAGCGFSVASSASISGFTLEDATHKIRTAISSEARSVVSNCLVRGFPDSVSLGGWMLDSEITDFHSDGGTCSYGVQLTGNGPIRLIRTKITDGTLHGNTSPSAPILDNSGCTTPEIADCEICCNTNYNGGPSAGVLSLNATGHYVSFTRCRCTDNAARHGVLRGGASNLYANMLYATNCLFARNMCIAPRYGTGSGQYNDLFWARGDYVNCTIADNGSEGDVLLFSCKGDEIYFKNTVISGNDVIGTYAAGGNVPTTTHSIYPEAVEGDGDLTGPARFIGRGRDPYRLAAGSPGVGAGALLDWTKDDIDLVGNRRVRGGAVDMGCYQSTPGMMIFVQ